jgi:hypothetical protein
MRFVANLRRDTIDAFAEEDIQPAAYLLSSHRVTQSALQAATTVRGLGLPLFADNGTKPLIEDTVEFFDERAKAIRLAVKEVRRQLGRVPRGSDIPSELREAASDLADEVVKHATDVSERIDPQEILDLQLSMAPTDLIAQEDFATACLIALALERETTGWGVSRFDTRNRRSLRLWKRVAEDPRCESVRVYAVLSAMDYNTARSAGRLAAAAGVTHAALGIAGITLDSTATDFFILRTAAITLETPAPRRHVRLAQILRGLADGYSDVGKVIESFHCLGLGAAAMFPIPAAALSDDTVLTTDATSPIHDAVNDRVVYDAEEDGERASTREIVQRIVGGGDWPFLSPFSKTFREQFGHDPERARVSWESQGRPPMTDQLLETPSDLTTALPLFSESNPNIRLAAMRTRIAHNHWVLGEVCDALRDKPGRHELAFAAIGTWLSRPTSATTTRGLAAVLQVLTRML